MLQVEQAPGRGHEDVDALFDAVDLRLHAHTAEDDGGGQLQVFAVRAHRFFNLGREFAGGGEHQGADAEAAELVGGAAAHGELVQHGQRERRGLAGAGLCAGEQVLPVEYSWNGLGLDWGGRVVALVAHSLEDGGSEFEIVEIHAVGERLVAMAHGISRFRCRAPGQ